MKGSLASVFFSLAVALSCAVCSGDAAAVMASPHGQQGFVYAPISSPIRSDIPSASYPIGLGSCATGGNALSLQIAVKRISNPVDVYLVIVVPELMSDMLILTNEGWKAFSAAGIVPWKHNVTDPVTASPLPTVPLSLIPSSTYYFALLMTTSGSLKSYYFWMTSLDTENPVDYSGLYYVTLSVQPNWKLTLHHSGSCVSFTLAGKNYTFKGQGSIEENTLALTAPMCERADTLNLFLAFPNGVQAFSGTWDMDPGDHGGTITGNRTPWPTYDVEKNGIPRFATANVIELSKISRVSKFRSGVGHDYSDDFETCRNMKHYFVPRDEAERPSIEIYSPLNGTVIATTEEWSPEDGWKGTNVGIQSKDFPAFHVVIMHIDLFKPLDVGDKVSAEQLLGTPPEYGNFTLADTIAGVNTPGGYKLLSFFEVMTDSVFQIYQARGMTSRNEAVISKEARDADPLECEGEEEFPDSGTLENWVYLN